MIVYGISVSSHDGGGTGPKLWINKDTAIKELRKIVAIRQWQDRKQYNYWKEKGEADVWGPMLMWKEIGPNHWWNGHESVSLDEFEIVDY